MQSRIIGDSPPSYGGKIARSEVSAFHNGECVLRYELNGEPKRVRFINYAVAKTAAIRAIFSLDNGIDGVCVTSKTPLDSLSYVYTTSQAWLSEKFY